MSKKSKNHSPQFKAKVALAAAKGVITLSELASQCNLHPNQITNWKKELIGNAALFFERGNKNPQRSDDIEKLALRRLVWI